MIYGVSQVAYYRAWDQTNGVFKTGDSGNHTVYVNKDGSAAASTNSPAEVDATNQPGLYKITLTASELTALSVALGGKSSTSGVVLVFQDVGPMRIPNADAGSSGGLGTCNASGNVPADVQTISGAAQTARDIGASVLLSVGTGAGQLNASGGKVPATVASGDGADASTLVARLTAARAGYLDNLNVGGAVASHADVAAINQSASKHLLLATVGQYERPESGSTVYTVECRTFEADNGAAADADTTPTLTATGQTSGDLSANLSAATHPATGVYRWTYTVASGATTEPLRFDVSATIASATFTLSAYSQVVDLVAATWTTADKAELDAMYNALPAGGATIAKAGDAMILTAAYDAAKAAAQASTALTNATWTDALAAALVILAGHDPGGNLMAAGNVTVGDIIQAALAKFATQDTGQTSASSGSVAQLAQGSAGASPLTAQQTRDAMKLAPSAGTPDAGSVDADLNTIISNTGSLSGSGAYTVTITVTDAGTGAAVQNATVRLSLNGLSKASGQTDSGGVVALGADAGDYSIAATCDGYSAYTGTVSVSGNTAAAFTMTASSVQGPADPNQVNCVGLTVDATGAPEAGVLVTFDLKTLGPTAQSSRVDPTVTSGDDGTYVIALAESSTYRFKRASGPESWLTFTTPARADADSFTLPTI